MAGSYMQDGRRHIIDGHASLDDGEIRAILEKARDLDVPAYLSGPDTVYLRARVHGRARRVVVCEPGQMTNTESDEIARRMDVTLSGKYRGYCPAICFPRIDSARIAWFQAEFGGRVLVDMDVLVKRRGQKWGPVPAGSFLMRLGAERVRALVAATHDRTAECGRLRNARRH